LANLFNFTPYFITMLDQREYQGVPVRESQQIRSAFDSYVNGFRKSDDLGYNRHMELKQEHTYGVVREAMALGRSLGMSLEQLAFVEVLALLHDLGRFEQFHTYGTFADAESENHAQMAVRISKELELLQGISKAHSDIIYQSILNHNLPKVPDEAPPDVAFYSRLLRDADKLDIWRVTLEYNVFHTIKTEAFPDSYTVPSHLIACFEANQCIALGQIDSYYDSILYRLSWLFDLNFRHTIDQFVQRNITGELFKKLPVTTGLNPIVAAINQYVQQVNEWA